MMVCTVNERHSIEPDYVIGNHNEEAAKEGV